MKLNNYATFVSALLAVVLSACATAPAPVDGDVVNLLSGTTNWLIGQVAGPHPPAAAEVLYSAKDQLAVVGTGFQEGYGFTVLDMKTMESLDDPAVIRRLTGNYVNWKTWAEFRDYLMFELGYVSQVLVMWTNTAGAAISQNWYTFVIGFTVMPSELQIEGVEVPSIFYQLPGLPAEGFALIQQ
jgi:hypothetical protein